VPGGPGMVTTELPSTNYGAKGQRRRVPLIRVSLVEGTFSTEQKRALAAQLTDVMVAFEGSEAFREVVWVVIEELKRDSWHIGGQPYAGPSTLMNALARSKAAYDTVLHAGDRAEAPRTREALSVLSPVRK
jgi:4-oxalocrotonate tautomerase